MDKIFASDIRAGSTIATYFLVAKKEKKLKKNGEPYLRLVLADRTGEIDANVWDRVADVWSVLSESAVVSVRAAVGEYQGKPQLTIHDMCTCVEGEYAIADLMKALPNSDEVWSEIMTMLNTVQDEALCMLIRAFVDDERFMQQFLRCPGGMKWHHAYIGGLLQHTYEVMRIAREMCAIHPEVNQDLVLVGAFLHDIGKIKELAYDMSFDYTNEGRLIGHICIGERMVLERVNALSEFPELLLQELLHIVLSHQGTYDQHSPVVPKTIEACIVYHSDHLTSQASAFKSVVYGPRLEGEEWSRYFPTIERQLLLREEKEDVL